MRGDEIDRIGELRKIAPDVPDFTCGHGNIDRFLHTLDELDQVVERRGVDPGDRLGRDDHPPHGLRRGVDQVLDERDEHGAVREEQWRVEPRDHQAGSAMSCQVPAEVVVARRAVEAHELCPVRVPCLPDERDERQPDRHEDALKHPDEGHTEERRDEQARLARTHPRESDQPTNVHERRRRDDHDRSERAGREVRRDAGEHDHEHEDEQCGHHSRQLRARARLHCDGGARRAPGDGEPSEQPGRGVGDPEGSHLLVAAHRVPVPTGKGTREHPGVRERDQGDACGRDQESHDVTRPQP
ncbi:hypothetical protein GALL_450430 [mine drainage metagenome]|uniref:Uncharacterized protein n=1 Tax=mine drainage metagenome TaxID=410659 RepID=A0A1J5PRA4_9ZZZZ